MFKWLDQLKGQQYPNIFTLSSNQMHCYFDIWHETLHFVCLLLNLLFRCSTSHVFSNHALVSFSSCEESLCELPFCIGNLDLYEGCANFQKCDWGALQPALRFDRDENDYLLVSLWAWVGVWVSEQTVKSLAVPSVHAIMNSYLGFGRLVSSLCCCNPR